MDISKNWNEMPSGAWVNEIDEDTKLVVTEEHDFYLHETYFKAVYWFWDEDAGQQDFRSLGSNYVSLEAAKEDLEEEYENDVEQL
jgi:uncharacterized membrane protein